MKIVVKNDKVLATHDDNQEVEGLYEGAAVFSVSENYRAGDDFIVSLDLIKPEKIKGLKAACGQELLGGFYSSALGQAHKYETKEVDQTNLMGMVLDGESDYYKCWNIEGTAQEWVFHTIEQLTQVFKDGKAWRKGVFQKLAVLENMVQSATTIEQVDAVVWGS